MDVAVGEASPEPSRSLKPPHNRSAHGSSYYSEPVNINGKSHRADVSFVRKKIYFLIIVDDLFLRYNYSLTQVRTTITRSFT